MGSNGCGKTTTIKLILGLLRPSNGSVKVFGSTPGSYNSDIPGIEVGFMPQELALFLELTIDENLKYFAKFYQINFSALKESYAQLKELLNLNPEKRVNELSGGQKRLVSMAMAFIHRPKLIILDEPTVGVDPIMVNKIWLFIKQMCEQKCKYSFLILANCWCLADYWLI